MLILLKFDCICIDSAFGTTRIHLKRVDSFFYESESKTGSTRGDFWRNLTKFKFKRSHFGIFTKNLIFN